MDSNEKLRKASGEVAIQSQLVSFLYSLMLEHLPPGVVEQLVRDAVNPAVTYTNGWLAKYAADLAGRLQLSVVYYHEDLTSGICGWYYWHGNTRSGPFGSKGLAEASCNEVK